MTTRRRSTTPPTADRVTHTAKRSVETAGSAGLYMGIEIDRVYQTAHVVIRMCECVCVCVCVCV